MQKCCQEIRFSQVIILRASKENVIIDIFIQGDSDIDQLFHIVKCLGKNGCHKLTSKLHLQVLFAQDTGTSYQRIQCTGRVLSTYGEIMISNSTQFQEWTLVNTVFYVVNEAQLGSYINIY